MQLSFGLTLMQIIDVVSISCGCERQRHINKVCECVQWMTFATIGCDIDVSRLICAEVTSSLCIFGTRVGNSSSGRNIGVCGNNKRDQMWCSGSRNRPTSIHKQCWWQERSSAHASDHMCVCVCVAQCALPFYVLCKYISINISSRHKKPYIHQKAPHSDIPDWAQEAQPKR